MSNRDLRAIQHDAEALTPQEQLQLAEYLMAKARSSTLKECGDLSEFKGSIQLTVDPVEYQKSVRADWP